MVGHAMSVDEVVASVLRDKPFFDASGGGVTLSGGEPTQHMDFAGAVLRELKRHGVHTLVETCGLFSFERFRDAMLPWLDTIYFDLKLFDAEAHRRYCGVSNELILDNFARLRTLSVELGFELLARTPLIPGITAEPRNLEGIASYLQALGVRRARLLPYNPTWGDKATQLGRPAADDVAPAAWMPRAAVEACSAVFERHGIEVHESVMELPASA
jgi:pyruvate formate lyase activating enzyme